MAAFAEKLTLLEFQSKYSSGERSYEFWYGEAVAKSMPTWIHGLLEGIILQLLNEAGYVAGCEVELRIVPDAHPKPDVIATSGEIKEAYPTKAVDVVVEILSTDDSMPYVLEKCEAYRTWGFQYIYLVNPDSRQLFRWMGTALELSDALVSIPASKIWQQLDRAMRREGQSS